MLARAELCNCAILGVRFSLLVFHLYKYVKDGYLKFIISLHLCDLMRNENRESDFIFYFFNVCFISSFIPLYVHAHFITMYIQQSFTSLAADFEQR